GKDHALQQLARLMKAAGAEHHLGPSEFISMPSVINTLERMPLSLCPMDEFGGFLRRINHKRAGSFEQGVTKVMRSAWGASFGMMMTPEWAGRPAKMIYAPAMSIYGVSTAEEFYSALEGGDVVNGVLNRFLVLNTTVRVSDAEPRMDAGKVPD